MSILIKPKLVSVDTEEYLPSHSKGKIENDSEETNGEAVFTEVSTKVSNLPYYIAYHRKRADRLFLHARGKENGLKHVDIRKGFLAIFWIIVFIVTMIVFIMMATNLFEQYDSGRVATQIKAEQDVMIFPDVTICAKVPFYVDDENAKNENTTDYILKKSEELIRKKLRDSSLRQTKSNIEAALLIEMAMKRENSFMRAYEHFIYCKYNDKDCSFYNFTEIVHLRYIQCFTFSPNDKVISGNKGLEFIFYKRHSRGKPFVMLNDLEDELFSSDIYDGINVIVHNPDTFPTYAFNYLSTSFALRYGQLATVDVSGLKYKSDMTGRKSCFPQRDPYRYTNFRGGANFLEYRYTYEDCIANMKQRYIYEKCNCYSDHLFVPFQDPKNNDSVYRSSYDTADLMNNPNVNEKQEDESIQKFSHFCRDIRHKTSHRLRNEFLCFEQYQKMPTTSVLDKFVQPDKLYATRHNLDARKIERHKVCSLLCEKRIYSTKFFEITDLDPEMTLPVPVIAHYIKALETSKLHFPELQNLWNKMQSDEQSQSPLTTGTTNETDETSLSSKNLIIVNIRISTELIDAWEEELTETLFNLISNLGGTVGLCAGISVLSSFFLVFFFGRALFHAALSLILWFWWAVYLGRPPLPDNNKLNQVNYIGNKIEDTDFHSANYGDSEHINNIEAMETSSSTVSTDTTEIINHSSPLHVSAKNDKSDKFEKFQINRKNLSAQKKSDNNKDKQILNDREESDVNKTEKLVYKLFSTEVKVDTSSSSPSSSSSTSTSSSTLSLSKEEINGNKDYYEESLPDYSVYEVSSEELTHGNTDVQHDNKVFKTDLPKKRMKVSHSSKHSADTLNKQRNSNTKPASTQQITHDNNDKINRRNQLLINEDDFQENTTWTLDRNNILNSDKFPFLYPPPPPALQKQTLNEKNEYDIYAISDDSYLKNPLQPILDQSVVPDYLFQRYAHSPF